VRGILPLKHPDDWAKWGGGGDWLDVWGRWKRCKVNDWGGGKKLHSYRVYPNGAREKKSEQLVRSFLRLSGRLIRKGRGAGGGKGAIEKDLEA